MKLKPLSDQVLVITGATSGIGLVTARKASAAGAKLVLVARTEDALRTLRDEVIASGGNAIFVVADVASEEDLQRVATEAVNHFGGFDTWVNNAAVSIYGRVLEVSNEDHRKLFETNYWGVVNGSRVAARHLRTRGGALINIGSTLSDRAIPIQGTYCASKHAVKGFTDALRMELEYEGAPISVTLIKPSAIDTPYKDHALNYLPVEPQNPPPVYAPEVVADAILYAAQHVVRDIFVGGGGKFMSMAGHYAPRVTDKVMEMTTFDLQRSEEPNDISRHKALYEPSGELKERGGYPGHVAESSIYTKASLHPFALGAAFISAAVLFTALRSHRSNGDLSQA